MRKRLAIAILTGAALLVAAAPASAWSPAGTYTVSTVALSFKLDVQMDGGFYTECSFSTMHMTLTAGVQDIGKVETPVTSTGCGDTHPLCLTTAVTAGGLPWIIGDPDLTIDAWAQVSFMKFTWTLSGASCPYAGASITVEGNTIANVFADTDPACPAGQGRAFFSWVRAKGLAITSAASPPTAGTSVLFTSQVATPCSATFPEQEM